jgi:alcohol dehydrogenase class IV
MVMASRFEFATASRILVGPGVVREVPAAVRKYGASILLVGGASTERVAWLRASLLQGGAAVHTWLSAGEPTVDSIRQAVCETRPNRIEVVVSVGGGSVIDAGKAIAAMLANDGDLMDYLEVIGGAMPLPKPSLPFIAIPTTAGTGSEVTRNAVLGSHERRVKVSLRSASMLPTLAVVDPELAYDLPRPVTVRTGLDALTQLIEPYVSVRANPVTDGFCLDGMPRVARSLREAAFPGTHAEARFDMAVASLQGGLALANAGLGIVHGFAAPVGGMFPAPHGAVCASLLPHAMAINIQALQSRQPNGRALARYETAARILTGTPTARAQDGVEWVTHLCEDLEVLPLRTYGVGNEDIPTLVERASAANSTKGNPLQLTREEMAEILARAI